MPKSLDLMKTARKSGNEPFIKNNKPLNFNLLNFWQWGSSDLLNSTNRGVLAEFIVANDLCIATEVTDDWAPYDLLFQGIKVEVKSGAYIQAWEQTEYSKIIFGIAPKRALDPKTNKMSEKIKRQSEVYVFCVLKHKDEATINPLNLDHWEFYILPTKILDEKMPKQKTIILPSLLRLQPKKVEYGGIKDTILEMIKV